MRKVYWFTIFSLFLALSSLPLVRAADQKAAEALIQKAITARGLSVEKPMLAETWNLSGKFHMGGQAFTFSGEGLFQSPNQYRMNMEMDISGQKMKFIIGVNGEEAYQAAADRVETVEDKKREYMLNQAHIMNVCALFPLLNSKQVTLSIAKEDKLNEQTLHCVLVKRDKHPDITLGFDAKTGHLVKLSTKVMDEFKDWAEVNEEIYFENYRSVEGVQFPSRMRILRGGELMLEEELSNQKLHKSLDAKKFAKPEEN